MEIGTKGPEEVLLGSLGSHKDWRKNEVDEEPSAPGENIDRNGDGESDKIPAPSVSALVGD